MLETFLYVPYRIYKSNNLFVKFSLTNYLPSFKGEQFLVTSFLLYAPEMTSGQLKNITFVVWGASEFFFFFNCKMLLHRG